MKQSNDNIHNSNDKYTNYNIIEIYINRLITTTQIFIAIDYLIMMSEKYLYFRKRKKHLARTFFTHPIEVTGSMYFGNIFSNYVFTKDMYKNIREIGIIQDAGRWTLWG